jgi:hypothetical protein
MAKHQYDGDVTQPYPQYLDAEKGTTLVAEPGQVYDVAAAEGWDLPVPPGDGRWGKAAKPAAKNKNEES